MDKSYNASLLLEIAARIPLSEASVYGEDDNDLHHGYRHARGTEMQPLFPRIAEDFTPIDGMFFSWLEPGGYILPHIDAGPHKERWQIPIQPAGRMIIAGIEVRQEAGVPFEVAHWHIHEVINDTDRPRIHLIIDRAIIAQPDEMPFQLR